MNTVKNTWSDLALFGGTAAFTEPIHVGRPNIGSRERILARVNDLLDRRWLSNAGPYVQEFEARIQALTGARHCIAMCNATVALEIAIRALGLTGEVIVPSFTFIATAHALQWQEITPVFCDIDSATHHIDPHQVERMITPRTSGIIGVHLWGRACDADALADIAQRHRLKLLLDAAHAFGCSSGGRMIGNFGAAEVFSFHATKFLNTFEGGAVVTNDDDLAKKIRLMKNFGFHGYDDVIYIGTNGKMSEVSAAMGLTGIESMDEFIAANRRNYEQYRRELSSLPGVRQMAYNTDEKCNYQYIVLEIEEAAAGLSRDQLLKILWAENVLARRYFYPGCHRMEPYSSYFPHAGLLLPVTEEVARRVLVLPTGTAVSAQQIGAICHVIRLALSHAEPIRARLRRDNREEILPTSEMKPRGDLECRDHRDVVEPF
jgi:dTDP-4-amino-4,6-dideoxygalactose transaminase